MYLALLQFDEFFKLRKSTALIWQKFRVIFQCQLPINKKTCKKIMYIFWWGRVQKPGGTISNSKMNNCSGHAVLLLLRTVYYKFSINNKKESYNTNVCLFDLRIWLIDLFDCSTATLNVTQWGENPYWEDSNSIESQICTKRPSIYYVSINTVLNVSKTSDFLDPHTQSFANVI